MNINLTLIGQMIAFAGFVWFCMKFVWPPIMAAMQEREQKIADGLAAADRASHDLELAKEKAVERLKEAKEEAAGIIDAANKRANQLVEEAKDAAVVEADRVQPVVNCIRESANTGKIGDGKIFVAPLEQSIRIRTGETGEDAI